MESGKLAGWKCQKQIVERTCGGFNLCMIFRPHIRRCCHAIAAALLTLVSACTAPRGDSYEAVMSPGMTIAATRAGQTMHIKALDAFRREYSWASMTKVFKLQGRQRRWYGSQGIYRPNGDGDVHAVLEEGQQHFDNIEDAMAWLRRQSRWLDLQWSANGLVVGWKEQRRQEDGFPALSVEVWQICIQGRKPRHLPGASEASLVVRGEPSRDVSDYRLPSAKVISGRSFTGRALGLMEDDGINAQQVLAVLRAAPCKEENGLRWYSGRDMQPPIRCLVCTHSTGEVLSVER
ncbi:hypothetical protein [Prosthecobacter sp.]|uniref:hypothetical protein n=1 Tax=Prosthecobacter sp. TaxID=1965333 RepID=UPI00248778C7|nr:hypothetical protein [Prosthecobacter sp.]MDI1311301.1 hypothetical protein [Prosthecobacter sp.]